MNDKKFHYHRMLNKTMPYLLLAPVVIYMIVVLAVPLLYGVCLGFTNKRLGYDATFVGLKNYLDLIKNKSFYKAVINTLKYTVTCVALKVFLGTALALLMNCKLKFRNIARGLLLIPWAVPTVVAVSIWKWMYSDTGGVMNHILMTSGIISSKIAWLSTPVIAFISLVIINVWRGSPFIAMSTLSGLQAIPEELYESAQIDGANSFRRFLHITLPSVKDVLMLSSLMTTIWTFNDFELIWLITKGGPIDTTTTISIFTYKTGIQNMQTGKAAASALLFMPIMILLINKVTSKSMNQEDT